MAHDGPLRFAIVGCGTIAPTHAAALRQLGDATRLVAVADIDRPRAAALAAQFNVPAVHANDADVYADASVDAVILCTPSGLHADAAVRALHAGKHVVIEKPMDVTVAACDRVIEAERVSGKTVAVISQHRFDAASERVKAAIGAGDLGRIFLADMSVKWWRTQHYYDAGAWRGTWALDGGGALMNQGIHTVDLLLWLAGPIARVTAHAATAGHARMETEDVVVAALRFESGAIGTLTASTACYDGQPARIDVYGTDGSAVIEGDRLKQLTLKSGAHSPAEPASGHALSVARGGTASVRDVTADRPPTSETGAVWGDAHRAQLADFIAAVRTSGRPRVGTAEARAAVCLIAAIYASARQGETVIL